MRVFARNRHERIMLGSFPPGLTTYRYFLSPLLTESKQPRLCARSCSFGRCQCQWKYLMTLWGDYSLPPSPQRSSPLCSTPVLRETGQFTSSWIPFGWCLHPDGPLSWRHSIQCWSLGMCSQLLWFHDQPEANPTTGCSTGHPVQLRQSCSSWGWAEILLPGEWTNAEVMEWLSAEPQPTTTWEGCPTTHGTHGARTMLRVRGTAVVHLL